jgi:predicted glycogen debranching enzyme
VHRLVLAADQFVARRGSGGQTVIARYPWFSDWGRDTMIALPGLTLSTGRAPIAAEVLTTFARFVSEGMLPNRFPDAGRRPSTTPSMRRCGTSTPSRPAWPPVGRVCC